MTELVEQRHRDAAAEALGYKDWDDASDYWLTGAQVRQRDKVVQAFALRERTEREAIRSIAERLREPELCDCAARMEGECVCGAWTGDKVRMLAHELERLCDGEG